jgi:transcriptional regulator with XRE-family HTH domain
MGDPGAGVPADSTSAPDEGEHTPPSTSCSLAEQLDRLFATFRDPVRNAEYTYEQVAETIARAGGPTISANYLYMLRRGVRDNPTKKHLEALAGFFRVSPGYFFGHAGSDQLSRELDLVAALRDSRVRDLAQTASGMSEETLAIIHRLVERIRSLEAEAGTLHGVESTRVPNGTEALYNLTH